MDFIFLCILTFVVFTYSLHMEHNRESNSSSTDINDARVAGRDKEVSSALREKSARQSNDSEEQRPAKVVLRDANEVYGQSLLLALSQQTPLSQQQSTAHETWTQPSMGQQGLTDETSQMDTSVGTTPNNVASGVGRYYTKWNPFIRRTQVIDRGSRAREIPKGIFLDNLIQKHVAIVGKLAQKQTGRMLSLEKLAMLKAFVVPVNRITCKVNVANLVSPNLEVELTEVARQACQEFQDKMVQLLRGYLERDINDLGNQLDLEIAAFPGIVLDGVGNLPGAAGDSEQRFRKETDKIQEKWVTKLNSKIEKLEADLKARMDEPAESSQRSDGTTMSQDGMESSQASLASTNASQKRRRSRKKKKSHKAAEDTQGSQPPAGSPGPARGILRTSVEQGQTREPGVPDQLLLPVVQKLMDEVANLSRTVDGLRINNPPGGNGNGHSGNGRTGGPGRNSHRGRGGQYHSPHQRSSKYGGSTANTQPRIG